MKVVNILIALLLLSGCTSSHLKNLTGEGVNGSQVKNNPSACNSMKRNCPAEFYEEWQASDGVISCSCLSK